MKPFCTTRRGGFFFAWVVVVFAVVDRGNPGKSEVRTGLVANALHEAGRA
jgi:hypothetical protein